MHVSFASLVGRHLTRRLVAGSLLSMSLPLGAAEIDTDIPDLRLRWDTTVGYSLGFRTKAPSGPLSQGYDASNFNDGDLNFSKRSRPITDRIDLFSEADVRYLDYGARVSGATWYDESYQTHTSNPSQLAAFPPPAPFDPNSTLNAGNPGRFPRATRDLHGQRLELLDAFLFGKFNLGSTTLNLRAGRHGLLWGESLYFGANAIASGMAPIDAIKALSSPNATIKEIVRPVNQLSAQWQVLDNLSFGAFYQFSWEKTRIPASGSYYSQNDAIDAGAQRLYLGTVVPTPRGPVTLVVPSFRIDDRAASDHGQFGVQTHFRIPSVDVDWGLYAIRYNAKTPVGYLLPADAPGATPVFRLNYPEGIKNYAASFNTTVGVVNFGGEASIRTNTPLIRGLMSVIGVPGGPFDASDNPAYGVGRSAHINLSAIVSVAPWFLARESSLAAEVAGNRVLSCQRNCVNQPPSAAYPAGYSPRDSNASRDAFGFRFVYTPTYRQVFAGVDLNVPIGGSYSPRGKSGVLGPVFINHGGDVSLGLVANVRETYSISLAYVHYYGPGGTLIDTSGSFSYKQSLKDRDNVVLSARMSF